MDSCKFCEIVLDRVAHIVLDDSVAVAFLDGRPLFHGHTLVIPRTHYETLLDLPPELLEPLFIRVQRVARAVQDTTRAEGTFVAVNNRVSQSVPHLHVHVVPRRRRDGLRGFFWPRTRYESDKQAAELANRLRAAIESVNEPESRGF